MVDCSRKFKGFTLIELLVVISIIALLLSILMPSLQVAKASARRVVCQAHMKQYATGLYTYSIDNKGALPVYADQWNGRGESYWYNVVAPYIGDLSEGTPENKWNFDNPLRQCPSKKAWFGVCLDNYNSRPTPRALFHYREDYQTGEKYPDVKLVNLRSPGTWFMLTDTSTYKDEDRDGGKQSFFYTPFAYPYRFDTDEDDLRDAYEERMPYNFAKPNTHRDGFNMVFGDTHIDTLDTETFVDRDNGYWKD